GAFSLVPALVDDFLAHFRGFLIALPIFVAEPVGHSVTGLAQQLVLTPGRRYRGSQQCAQCNADRTQRQRLFGEQMVEAAAGAIGLVSQAVRSLQAAVSNAVAGLGRSEER